MEVLKTIFEYNSQINHVLINCLLGLILALVAYQKKDDSNLLFIIAMLLAPKIADILVINKILLSGIVPNFSVYLIYSVYDALVLWLILYRADVIKFYLKAKIKVFSCLGFPIGSSSFTYARHVNEFKIIVIFAASILINIAVAAEYPFRWYISKDILYLYYLYAPLKFGLNIALVFWVINMKPNSKRIPQGVM